MSEVRTTPVRIAGELVLGAGSVDVVDPHRGDVVGRVPLCGATEVDAACAAASAALDRRGFAQHDRARVLDRASQLVRERQEALALTIVAESAKPLKISRAEVARCADTLAFSAVEARRLCGELVAMEASRAGAGKLGFGVRVPIGVVAAITPFNFPLNLVAHKLGPAIAAGCPVVLKPAPQTPLTALAFVELLVDAGMPADWISTVTDDGTTAGQALVAHPVPAMVSFTGSAPVGWAIAAAAPRKRVVLELGSSTPVIVEPDADVKAVASKVKVGGFSFAGQSCISVQRVLVHRAVHEELLEELSLAVATLVVGDPRSEDTDLGPMIRPAENDRVTSWIARAVEGGGRLVAGGEVVDGILQPTIVDSPPLDSDICQREVFAPLVAVIPYDSIDEAIQLANSTDLRLQAGIFTSDIGVALEASRSLRFGGVIVNDVPTFRADQQPYGGVADAGNTREGPAYAVREMTDLRFVSLQGPNGG